MRNPNLCAVNSPKVPQSTSGKKEMQIQKVWFQGLGIQLLVPPRGGERSHHIWLDKEIHYQEGFLNWIDWVGIYLGTRYLSIFKKWVDLKNLHNKYLQEKLDNTVKYKVISVILQPKDNQEQYFGN